MGNTDSQNESINSAPKGLLPGVLTRWFVVMIVGAVLYGLEMIQTFIDLFFIKDITQYLGTGKAWIIIVAFLIVAGIFTLHIISAIGIYRRRTWSYTCSSAASIIGFVFVVFICVTAMSFLSAAIFTVIAIGARTYAKSGRTDLVGDKE